MLFAKSKEKKKKPLIFMPQFWMIHLLILLNLWFISSPIHGLPTWAMSLGILRDFHTEELLITCEVIQAIQ
jgi:hypothetical protein